MSGISQLFATVGDVAEARDLDDATLLARYVAGRDAVAFDVLVWRHGGLVRGVCRRYLRDANDIDDATQAAFLALARKARSVRVVGPWLAQVATHAALRLRRENATRSARLTAVTDAVPARESPTDDGWRGVLAEEIERLPDQYRTVVRRCYLDGRTAAEVGHEMGWPRGTVLTRLAWAKARLRQRLTGRGVVLGVGGVVGLLYQFAAGPVSRAAACDLARGVATTVAPRVIRLTDGVLSAMFWTKVKFAAGVAMVCGSTLLGLAAANAGATADGRATGQTIAASAVPADTTPVKTKPAAEGDPVVGTHVKTKPGVGPGFGDGGPAPARTKPAADEPTSPRPAKTKPGVGPGSGSGAPMPLKTKPAATFNEDGPVMPVRTKPGVGPGFGFGGDD